MGAASFAPLAKGAVFVQVAENIGGRDRDRTGDPLLAKQVLSQLSYTPTVRDTLILKHFQARRNPFLRITVTWSEPLD